MKTRSVLPTLTLVLSMSAFAAGPKPSAPANSAVAAFERLKALVGDWEANTDMGKVTARFELASNGNVVVERASMAGGEMMTTYYLDGDKIGATHYCDIGNQPRLQANGLDPDGQIRFHFLNAANLKPGQDHIHDVSIRVQDVDHFSDEWVAFENGKPKMHVAGQYVRVK